MISNRARSIPPSATLAITAAAKALKAQGRDVIGLAAGEPDFDTPQHIRDAASEAMAAGQTRYTPAAGTLALREAIAARARADLGQEYDPATQVLVSSGAKHVLANLFAALLDPGDEVIIPAPYWVSFPMMALAVGATPVFVPTRPEEDFRLDPDRLRAALTARTKIVVLNFPSNPTGATTTPEALEATLESLRNSPAMVVSDEIYDRLIYEGRHLSPASCDGWRERSLVVNGVSKTYAMTGWRVGWALGPAEVIAAATRIQSHTASAPSTISQAASIAALAGPQDCVEQMRAAFDRRRRLVLDGLAAVPGLRCATPRGAFYAFPDVSAHFGRSVAGRRIDDSAAFCSACLEGADVALVPGDAFGADHHVRLSYATSEELLERALARIAEFVQGLE